MRTTALLLALTAGLIIGCTSNSTGMSNSNSTPMLQPTDYQPEPSNQKYMKDKNGSSPTVDFIRYPLIDL
ncbi:hypothetical protein [Acinetobacter sp. GXMZU3951]